MLVSTSTAATAASAVRNVVHLRSSTPATAFLRTASPRPAAATAASRSAAGPSSSSSSSRATRPPPQLRAFHASAPTSFDAQSLSASAQDEGARIGAVCTPSKTPVEPVEESLRTAGAGDSLTVVLTRRAVERLQRIAAQEAQQHAGQVGELALRLAVEPGGCHGYQYKIELTEEAEEDDFHFHPPAPRHAPSPAPHSVQPLPILIDSVSLALLKGATIDYVTELIGSQFAIRENPQAKGSGCGCGISWEPAV
ncbi:[4Fe-4S] proteins maturation [Tilletia horrida]|nr:[4Fe-4S] proteins maturation [Tilletia horrida]